MKSAWELDEAKDHLREVLDSARQRGEQTITENGKPVAILRAVETGENRERREERLSEEAKLARGTGASLIALLQRCPAPEIFDIMEEERRKDRARGLRELEL